MKAKIALLAVLLSVIGLHPCLQPGPTVVYGQTAGTKKLLYYGWGSPDTQYVREHWRQMEEMPFDGVGIVVPMDYRAWQQGKRDTTNQLGWRIMGRRAFRIEEFSEVIADLKVPQWRRLTDNFLPVALSAAQSAIGLNWFDNERWQIVQNNFEVLARIAAQAGIKGFIFDPEHYNCQLFDYNAQRKQSDRPMADYQEMARQRGREVMKAIAVHRPQAVILSLYLHTYPLSQTLEKTRYKLLPAFYDGLLEAMPSGATLVDGYESAYPYKRPDQFIAAYQRIQEAVQISAVPEHYRAKVRAGFGLWLDYRRKADYFTPEEFRRAVAAALEISDGYVWIYSEGPRFFPPSDDAPDYIKALIDARSPASPPPAKPTGLRVDPSVK